MVEQTYREFAAAHPAECTPVSWVEDARFLSQFGIAIADKESFPQGVVKFLPQDFIVEEILSDGSQCTIGQETDTLLPFAADGDTVYATLVKCNISTFEAVRQLAAQLGCSVDQIQYAGIKDQRAITAQRVSFRKVPLEAVQAITSSDFFLKDIVRGKGVLQPGQLTGNRFTILVRTSAAIHEPATVACMAKQLTKVATEGFYNFFYLQRFSSPRYINFKWGRDILLGNYEAVVRSILLEQTPTEVAFFGKVRTALESRWGDWDAMLTYLDEQVPSDVMQTERAALAYLVQHPGDFLGVLTLDTRQTQLWVYAFGSKIFNQQLSFLARKGAVPRELPTILSPDRTDTALYRYLFEAEGVWPPTWPSLRAFPHIQRRRQTVPTTIPVEIHSIDVVEAGIVLQFTLQKGGYATTFLSHLFNLRGGSYATDAIDFNTEDVATIPDAVREIFAEALAQAQAQETTDEPV